VAEPVVQRLAEMTGETISVGMLDGTDIVYIHRLKAAPAAQMNTPVGARAPAHCTSLGKILLADHTPDEVKRLVGEGPYPSFTPGTITRLEDLQSDLARTRQRQYAVNDEEHRLGQVCMATPIRDYTGIAIAAISVSLPAIRARGETRESVLSYLQNASEEISTALGFHHRRHVSTRQTPLS
jgi:DNA-binding IclR family transcriptional regulator